MTVASRQNQVAELQRDITRINRKLSDLARDEADANARIAQFERSIATTTSPVAVQSRQRQIKRWNGLLLKIKGERAGLARDLARKTDDLHKAQNELFRAQRKEHAEQIESLLRDRREIDAAASQTLTALAPPARDTAPMDVQYDAFISHASEDKADVARPLFDALAAMGYRVWLDVFELKVGDSLRRTIDRGLAASRFGIVVLSPDFMAKSWTGYELDGLVARENASGKMILPLWHKVSKSEVLKFSPSLADKMALSTSFFTTDELAQKLADALGEPCGSARPE